MTTDPYGTPPADSNYGAPPPNYDLPPGDPGFYGPPDRSEAASKKLAAGITGILLGTFGVHKFILNYTTAGAIMLAVSVATLVLGFATCGITLPAAGIMGIIGLIEGIIYLTKSDEEFYQTYMLGKKEWF
ncbi:MAG: TM2 domain-containing protein [Planctomycetaceae bacterium]|nr:TM2 domain-containing protein [Planctomycetaceae bacterium]